MKKYSFFIVFSFFILTSLPAERGLTLRYEWLPLTEKIEEGLYTDWSFKMQLPYMHSRNGNYLLFSWWKGLVHYQGSLFEAEAFYEGDQTAGFYTIEQLDDVIADGDRTISAERLNHRAGLRLESPWIGGSILTDGFYPWGSFFLRSNQVAGFSIEMFLSREQLNRIGLNLVKNHSIDFSVFQDHMRVGLLWNQGAWKSTSYILNDTYFTENGDNLTMTVDVQGNSQYGFRQDLQYRLPGGDILAAQFNMERHKYSINSALDNVRVFFSGNLDDADKAFILDSQELKLEYAGKRNRAAVSYFYLGTPYDSGNSMWTDALPLSPIGHNFKRKDFMVDWETSLQGVELAYRQNFLQHPWTLEVGATAAVWFWHYNSEYYFMTGPFFPPFLTLLDRYPSEGYDVIDRNNWLGFIWPETTLSLDITPVTLELFLSQMALPINSQAVLEEVTGLISFISQEKDPEQVESVAEEYQGMSWGGLEAGFRIKIDL